MLDLPLVAQSLDFTCGAACFDSMIRHFKGASGGEMHFAGELGTLASGFTPVENVVALARAYGFKSELQENASLRHLEEALRHREVCFVTWWDEDAGHYSLVQHLEPDHILLMDPWLAREGRTNRLPLAEFLPNWNLRGAKLIRVWT